ncbi:hypothetical protein MKW92_041293 [Papaver armeniacum]|nr:hypothetical protein MKW92_041293 [Papaver armeniacum]
MMGVISGDDLDGVNKIMEKTIQRMELVILSSLHRKMNPVTPPSFLVHIIRRLGLKSNLHWEFITRDANFSSSL